MNLAAWAGALPAIVAALFVVLLPGLIATAPLRIDLVPRAALGGAVSIALVGVSGVVAGATGVGFSIWQPFVLAVLAGLLVWIVIRRMRPAPPAPTRSRWWWLLLAWAGTALVMTAVAFAAVPTPDRISQTYDNVFHLSAIAHILDTGDASSLTLRTLIETDKTWSFYPSGWHSVVALTAELSGASVPVAVNASTIAVCAAIWLPGIAWLSQVVVRGFDPTLVAVVALPLGAAFGAMPYALLTWGTLYPTLLGTALLPAALAPVVAAGLSRRGESRVRYPLAMAAAMTSAAVVAVAFAQPRVLVTWALILAPYVIIEAARTYRQAVRRGGRDRVVARRILTGVIGALLVVAAGGFAYLVLRLGLFERPLDQRLGGPQAQASQPVFVGIGQVLVQSWPLGVDGVVTFPAILLALAVIGGIAVAVRTRGLRWLVVSYAALAVLFALAAGSDDVLTKLATALWYKDRYRISSALPIIAIPLATLGILTAARWASRSRRAFVAAAAALSVAVAGIAAAGLAWASMPTFGYVFRLPDRAASSEVISRAQIDFMRDVVAAVVPPDQRLLGDPWDGSALSQVYAGREPVFPHVNGQWDPQRGVIAWHLPDIDKDPAVCAALDALRVRYVLYHPHEFGGGDPSGNHFLGVHAAVQQGLFTAVATDGDSTLYRIDQCGPLRAD